VAVLKDMRLFMKETIQVLSMDVIADIPVLLDIMECIDLHVIIIRPGMDAKMSMQ
jgi:hypothetical protein